MSFSSAIEDYAKALYALEQQHGGAVTTTALAERLGVTPGSASAMVRKLGELGLAEHEPYRGARLTASGRKVALEVVRHHRLLELFLAEVLEVPWDEVHEEAEVLEHVLSEKLEARIAAKLGNPTTDPHGDPIPGVDLDVADGPSTNLASLAPGVEGVVRRISDRDPAMLRYLTDMGVGPGDDFAVVGRQPFGGPLTVRFDGGERIIGETLAAAIWVDVTDASPPASAPAP